MKHINAKYLKLTRNGTSYSTRRAGQIPSLRFSYSFSPRWEIWIGDTGGTGVIRAEALANLPVSTWEVTGVALPMLRDFINLAADELHKNYAKLCAEAGTGAGLDLAKVDAVINAARAYRNAAALLADIVRYLATIEASRERRAKVLRHVLSGCGSVHI